MRRQDEIKERWFELGAQSLSRILKLEIRDTYVCPLCRGSFERSQLATDLSFEHAPPESLGGKRLILTCRPCNSFAGTRLDAAAKRDERTRAFLAGGGRAPRTVRVTRDGTAVRGELTADSEGIAFNAISKQNDPELLRRFTDSAHEWARSPKEGREIRIEIPVQFRSRQAHLSWLKTAYVAAFATFGYRFALQSGVEALLEQLQQPDEVLIEDLPLGYERDADPTTRQVAVITAPRVALSIMVKVGQFTAYLPVPEDRAFLAEFRERLQLAICLAGDVSGESATFAVDSYGWPSEPMHLWDRLQ